MFSSRIGTPESSLNSITIMTAFRYCVPLPKTYSDLIKQGIIIPSRFGWYKGLLDYKEYDVFLEEVSPKTFFNVLSRSYFNKSCGVESAPNINDLLRYLKNTGEADSVMKIEYKNDNFAEQLANQILIHKYQS